MGWSIPELLKRKIIEEKVCPNCTKYFYTYIKPRKGKKSSIRLVKPRHCKFCSKKCAREKAEIERKKRYSTYYKKKKRAVEND